MQYKRVANYTERDTSVVVVLQLNNGKSQLSTHALAAVVHLNHHS